MVYTFNIHAGAWPIEAQYYNGAISASNLLATITQTWNYNQLCPPNAPCYSNGNHDNVGFVTKASRTVSFPITGGISLNQTTQYSWDLTNFGNVTQRADWNFYSGSLPTSADRTTAYGYLNGTPYLAANIVNRRTSVTVTDKNANTVAKTLNTYDGSALTAVSNVAQHDDTDYGASNLTRGNLTQVQRLVSGTSNYLTTNMTYDTTGQMLSSTDSAGNATTYSYADNFFNDAGDFVGPAAFTPPAPTNAYIKTENQGSLTTIFGYYWGTGQQALLTDPNSKTTYHHFFDVLNRSSSTQLPNSGWSSSQYNSTETEVDSYTGITSTGPSGCTGCRHDERLMDGLGRLNSKILVSDPDGATTVATTYDADGRVYSASNPYRNTTDPTYGLEKTSYDGLDRGIQVTHADGDSYKTFYGAAVSGAAGAASQLCSTSTYGFGYPVLRVNEIGNKIQTWTDGFGRLIEADEPDSTGNLAIGTCYTYDLNDNLTAVVQGTETRTFSHDLVSRTTSTNLPETLVTNYYYTTSAGAICSGEPSNVCRRVDAKGTTTTYGYDSLNRRTSKAYSDSTPAIAYYYDQSSYNGLSITNGKNRRTGMSDSSGQTAWSYDSVGNILEETRTIDSVTKSIFYSYALDGKASGIQYPTSGDAVTYVIGNAERETSAIDAHNSVNYATAVSYAPEGSLARMVAGSVSSGFSGINVSNTYNNRLQPSAMSASSTNGVALSLTYNFDLSAVNTACQTSLASPANNSDVAVITNNLNASRSQSFCYDHLNRIASARTQATSGTFCWGEAYGYDRWGNLLSIGAASSSYFGCTQEGLSVMANSHNQVVGFCYDMDGNLLAETTSPCTAVYNYDAENELISTAGITYQYDGDGKRVKKSNGTLYWYGTNGEPLAESDLSGNITNEYVFIHGTRIARRTISNGSVIFYFGDHLGSARIVVNATGTVPVLDDSDFYPFGGERIVLSASGNTFKFTGKERDIESGLDDFGARFHASSIGRFMSADLKPFDGKLLANPQDLNLYTFTLDNPLRYHDPDGKDWATAWKDFKVFANSVYLKYSIGGGIEASQKGLDEIKAGAVAKVSVEVGGNKIGQLSETVDIGVKVAPTQNGPQAGLDVSASKSIVVDSNRNATEVDTLEKTVGLSTTTTTNGVTTTTSGSRSGDQIGLGFELGAPVVEGFEAGASKEGWSALKDAGTQALGALYTPPPPPPKTPPPPAATVPQEISGDH
ncbi:MAG: RHS repeat-associated core domain-containing protein [Candidatus Acidiferrales bacterium]